MFIDNFLKDEQSRRGFLRVAGGTAIGMVPALHFDRGGRPSLARAVADELPAVTESAFEYKDFWVAHGAVNGVHPTNPDRNPAYTNLFDAYRAIRNDPELWGNGGSKIGRMRVEYSATPYGGHPDGKSAFDTRGGTASYTSFIIEGETGGPATAIDETFVGDGVTSQFEVSLPQGVVSPLGLGDFVVTVNGRELKVGVNYHQTAPTSPPRSMGLPAPALASTYVISMVRWDSSLNDWVPNPVPVGAELKIRSKEARPILTADTMVLYVCGQGNNSWMRKSVQTDYFSIKNIVCYPQKWHKGDNVFLTENVFVDNCHFFGFSQSFADCMPYYVNAMTFKGVWYTRNSCMWGSGASALTHNQYGGFFAYHIWENVYSTDCAAGSLYSEAGHNGKFKARIRIYVRGGLMADSYYGQFDPAWLAAGSRDWSGTTPVSLDSECDWTVFEDVTLIRAGRRWNSSGSNGFFFRSGRRSPYVEATAMRPVYGRLKTTPNVNLDNVETHAIGRPPLCDVWYPRVDGLRTSFGWTTGNGLVPSPKTAADIIVSVAEPGRRARLLDPDEYGVSGLGSSSGSVDLAAGARPYGPPQVGAYVFTSTGITRKAQYFNGFFSAFRSSRVLLTYKGRDGSRGAFPWSVGPSKGDTDAPLAADFHVSVNGETMTAGQDYQVVFSGPAGDAREGFIQFATPPRNNDTVIIATDAACRQRIPFTDFESPETVSQPVDGVHWTLEGYEDSLDLPAFNPVFIHGCRFFGQRDIPGDDTFDIILDSGSAPTGDVNSGSFPHPLPATWKERHIVVLANNVFCGVDPATQLSTPTSAPVDNGWSSASEAVHDMGGNWINGMFQKRLALPEWFATWDQWTARPDPDLAFP